MPAPDNDKSILVLNGPNLNLLGTREPEKYGRTTLADVYEVLKQRAAQKNVKVDFFQSNFEGALVERIHQAKGEGVGFFIINPGALTHTSVALRDAFGGVAIPFIEVHITNVHAREPFRHHSYLSDVAKGIIIGLGVAGYYYALDYAADALQAAQG